MPLMRKQDDSIQNPEIPTQARQASQRQVVCGVEVERLLGSFVAKLLGLRLSEFLGSRLFNSKLLKFASRSPALHGLRAWGYKVFWQP